MLSISLYASCERYIKMSFLRNSVARKSSWTKRLENCAFSFQIVHWKRIIRTRLTFYWNAFFVFVFGLFLIYVYSWGLNTEFSYLRRRRCFYNRQRRWFLGRQWSRAGPLRSSHQRYSVRKSVLRNLAKFIGKHLCQSFFFNKVPGLLYWKGDPGTGFFLWVLRNF